MRSIPFTLIVGFMYFPFALAGRGYYSETNAGVAEKYKLVDTISVRKDSARVLSDTFSVERDTVIKKDSLVIISSRPGLSTASGFRVQIFSSRNLSEAYEIQLKADSLLPGFNIYLIYDPPYYKVRVGDFRARYEANQAAGFIIARGFQNAWVVPDNVFKKRMGIR
ncbi:MAG: SPOR domain-containing protein [Candidatus Kryptoniota bacterium]